MDHFTELGGVYTVTLSDGREYTATLPGTLDENGIGDPDLVAGSWHPDEHTDDGGLNEGLHIEGIITSRFTRCRIYDGAATFTRDIPIGDGLLRGLEDGGRAFLFIERSRKLKVTLGDCELAPYDPGTLSTPWIYEVTDVLRRIADAGVLRPDSISLSLTVDNTYPGWPAVAIRTSSAATDETQTNWNGVIGRMGIILRGHSFIESARMLPDLGCGEALPSTYSLILDIDAAAYARGEPAVLELRSVTTASARRAAPSGCAAGSVLSCKSSASKLKLSLTRSSSTL